MLSSQRLRRAILLMCATGFMFFLLGNIQAASLILTADLVLLGLLYASREDNITLKVTNLFDENVQVNEFLDKMKTDPAFAQAVHYVFNLSSNDLLKFARLIVEMRYEADQKVLALFAKIFRKEQP